MTARLSFRFAIRSSGKGTKGSTISGTDCSTQPLTIDMSATVTAVPHEGLQDKVPGKRA